MCRWGGLRRGSCGPPWTTSRGCWLWSCTPGRGASSCGRGWWRQPATRAVIEAVRGAGVEGPGADRFLAPDLALADAFVRDGRLVVAAESVTGPLA